MADKMLKLSEKQCPVEELLKYIRGHKCLECGKCVFGYEGASQLELTLDDISKKKSRSTDMAKMQSLCEMMKTQVLCDEGVELAETVADTLAAYADDVNAHIAKKSCNAGVCKKFVTYHILADKCIGCGDCMDECDDDAILGKKKFIHVIDQDECTQCGNCLKACDEDAIVIAGAVKPRCPAKPIPCKR